MGRKSNAQINRMKRRAAARGEEYNESSESVESKKNARKLAAAVRLGKQLDSIEQNEELKAKDRRSAKRKAEAIASEEAECPVEELLEWYDMHGVMATADPDTSKVDGRKLAAAVKLEKELKSIEGNEEMKSKDRRSAKRKAEAIASQEAGCPAEKLLEWHSQYKKSHVKESENDVEAKGGEKATSEKSFHNPYIVFVGQLSYTTTREALFQHFQNELGKEHTVTEETLRIRLLTDPKTKKSRGMAFVETADPELLYACLKMHHTHLDGRRINVERSAGGKRNSDSRKSKITQYRKEQEQHMSETVDKMLDDYRNSGDLDENELDDGVVALCKRHSATVVETALAEYVEARGREMDNPSAYLTFIIGRIATEGPTDEKVDKWGKKKKRAAGDSRSSGRSGDHDKKRHFPSGGHDSSHGTMGNKIRKQSEFSMKGVDMSVSNASAGSNLSKIFPSLSRGRGRGRGYM